jgi:hypothetical protein
MASASNSVQYLSNIRAWTPLEMGRQRHPMPHPTLQSFDQGRISRKGGAGTMPEFRAGTPAGCPGDAAKEFTGTIFRACATNPPTDEDFTSHAHSTKAWKRKKANPTDCSHWGLSVWVSAEDVRHACTLFSWLRCKVIFRGQIRPVDGRLAQTGTIPHHTFWPYDKIDLISRFQLHNVNVG